MVEDYGVLILKPKVQRKDLGKELKLRWETSNGREATHRMGQWDPSHRTPKDTEDRDSFRPANKGIFLRFRKMNKRKEIHPVPCRCVYNKG